MIPRQTKDTEALEQSTREKNKLGVNQAAGTTTSIAKSSRAQISVDDRNNLFDQYGSECMIKGCNFRFPQSITVQSRVKAVKAAKEWFAHLCLCPNHAYLFQHKCNQQDRKEWLDHMKNKEQFLGDEFTTEFPINMGRQEHVICFRKDHLAKLRGLFNQLPLFPEEEE